VKSYVLIHEHTPAECAIAYAAWRGFVSPLRGRPVQSTCARHVSHPPVHEIWWTTQAENAAAALMQVPPYVRDRSEAREVSEVMIG
jgi:hypothetical protein